MGIMRRELFFTIAFAVLLTAPCMAAMTVEESTDSEYLLNSGYSQATVEDTFMMKNRMTGQPIEPLYEQSQNKFVKACKKFYAYIDPGIEMQDKLHHDIKQSPSTSDL